MPSRTFWKICPFLATVKSRRLRQFFTQANKRHLPTSPFISFNFLLKTDFLTLRKNYKKILDNFRKGREGVLHAKSGKWVHWAPVIQNKFWLPWMGECHNKLIFFWQTNWVAKILSWNKYSVSKNIFLAKTFCWQKKRPVTQGSPVCPRCPQCIILAGIHSKQMWPHFC